MAGPDRRKSTEIAQLVIELEQDQRDIHPELLLTDQSAVNLLREIHFALDEELEPVFKTVEGGFELGRIEVREGSVLLVLHVLGDAALWIAAAEGTLALLARIRDLVVPRIERFLGREYAALSGYAVTSTQIVVVNFPSSPVRPAFTPKPDRLLLKYLLASHAVLLLTVIGVLIALLSKVL
jgi:hypothetical protein